MLSVTGRRSHPRSPRSTSSMLESTLVHLRVPLLKSRTSSPSQQNWASNTDFLSTIQKTSLFGKLNLAISSMVRKLSWIHFCPTSFDKGWSQVLGPWDGVKLQREQTWEGSWWEEGRRGRRSRAATTSLSFGPGEALSPLSTR